MVLPALILATGVALPLHPAGPPAEGHWATAVATATAGTHRRHLSAGTHGHQGGHPVESGRPRAKAPHERRPAATHTALRQATKSDWVLVVRPQHRRLGPAAVPAQKAVLRPGFLAHRDSAAAPVGPWLRIFDGQGKSWVNVTNVRPAQAPAGWDRLVVKIHPALRHVRTVSHLPSPLPVANAVPATSPGTAAATPAPAATAAPQQVVQVVQVVQPAPVVVQPALLPLQQVVHDRAIAIWGQPYDFELNYIITHESGWQLEAVNPSSGARGLFQRWPASTLPCAYGDAGCIVDNGLQYIRDRYGNPYNAYLYWVNHGNY